MTTPAICVAISRRPERLSVLSNAWSVEVSLATINFRNLLTPRLYNLLLAAELLLARSDGRGSDID